MSRFFNQVTIINTHTIISTASFRDAQMVRQDEPRQLYMICVLICRQCAQLLRRQQIGLFNFRVLSVGGGVLGADNDDESVSWRVSILKDPGMSQTQCAVCIKR